MTETYPTRYFYTLKTVLKTALEDPESLTKPMAFYAQDVGEVILDETTRGVLWFESAFDALAGCYALKDAGVDAEFVHTVNNGWLFAHGMPGTPAAVLYDKAQMENLQSGENWEEAQRKVLELHLSLSDLHLMCWGYNKYKGYELDGLDEEQVDDTFVLHDMDGHKDAIFVENALKAAKIYCLMFKRTIPLPDGINLISCLLTKETESLSVLENFDLVATN